VFYYGASAGIILQDLVKQVEPLVRSAGQAIMGYFRHDFQQREKSLGDFVTEADLASQKILIVGLTKLLPQAQVISEELANSSRSLTPNAPTAEYCWVIDPLDGTNNFRHGIPHFAISIALIQNQKTVLGVIYDPVRQELFYAVSGQGVYYNHQKLAISPDVQSHGSARELSIELSKSENSETKISFHNRLITTNIRAIYLLNLELEGALLRKFGSAALDLAYAAMGWIDLVAYQGLYNWDFAAGELLVLEARKQFHQVHLDHSWGGGHQILAGPAVLVTQMCRYIN
jgi:myo-inositol-1(or 4)-monophosphatase